MAKCYSGAAGGLNAADKATAEEWMVEGHSILNGKVAGTIIDHGSVEYKIHMFDQAHIIIPAGYYAEDIKVYPEYISGTVLTIGSWFGTASGGTTTANDGWSFHVSGSNPLEYEQYSKSGSYLWNKPINLQGFGTITPVGSITKPGHNEVSITVGLSASASSISSLCGCGLNSTMTIPANMPDKAYLYVSWSVKCTLWGHDGGSFNTYGYLNNLTCYTK